MRKLTTALMTLAILSAAAFAIAQQAPDGPRPDGQGPGPGQGRPRGFRPSPVMAALDANQDGEISADEIDQAVSALKKLDKNGDGKLTAEETRPVGRGAGGGLAGPDGAPGGGGPGRGGPDAGPGPGGPDGPGPGGEGGRRGPGGGGFGGGDFVERVMAFDEDKDGKLTKDELTKWFEQIGRGRGGRGGGQGGAGGPGGGSGRPQRPPQQ